MADRCSKSDLERVCLRVNLYLERMNKPYRIKCGRRYNYYAIDKVWVDPNNTGEANFTTGNLRECLTYVNGMDKAFSLMFFDT